MVKALKAYAAAHPEVRTQDQLAKKLGVSSETLRRLMLGLSTPAARSRARIFSVTHAEVFRRLPGNRPRETTRTQNGRQYADDILREVRKLSSGVERLRQSLTGDEVVSPHERPAPEKVSARARAEAVARILGQLDRELAFFKEESRQEARHTLRRVVDAKDVGYLIALLKAMYDDDAFENWIFGAEYGATRTK